MPNAADIERFREHWLDYVCELNSCPEEEALRDFASHYEELSGKVGPGIVLWRSMTVPEERVAEFEAGQTVFAGRYWTGSAHVAGVWTGGSTYDERHPACTDGVRIVIEARVSADGIDWVETVACQLGSNFEQEYRLLGDAPVLVASCRIADPEPVLSP